jgi:hypothetical protein
VNKSDGSQALYVKKGYTANVVKEYSTPAGQTVKQYEIAPIVVPDSSPVIKNSVFTGENLNFAGVKPIISTNEQRVTAVSVLVTAGVPVAAAGLGLGRASTIAAQGLLGGGLGAGFEYLQTGKVTPQNVVIGAAEGMAFGVVGGKAISVLGVAGQGAKSVLGRVAVNTALGAGFAAGGEVITTGKVTPQTVAAGAAFGAAFGVAGEATGYGAARLNRSYGITERPIVRRLSGAVAGFDESVGGVRAVKVVGGREMQIKSGVGGEVKVARVTQLDVKPTRISKSQAELFRGASAKKIEFAGLEQRTVLSGRKAPEPQFVKPVYERGVAKNYRVDYDAVVASESEQAVAGSLTNLGEGKAAKAYLNQYRSTGQFESTRVADPYLASVQGKEFVGYKERIGDLRRMVDTRVEGTPRSVSNLVYDVDAYGKVKVSTGVGNVGGAKDSGVVMVSKRVKAIGAVPKGKVVTTREITGIKLSGKIDESLSIDAIKALPKDLQDQFYLKMGGGVKGDLPLEYEQMLRSAAKSKAGNLDTIPGVIQSEKMFSVKQTPSSVKPKGVSSKGLVELGKSKSVVKQKIDLPEGIIAVEPRGIKTNIGSSVSSGVAPAVLSSRVQSEKTVTNPFVQYRGRKYYVQGAQVTEDVEVLSYPDSGLKVPSRAGVESRRGARSQLDSLLAVSLGVGNESGIKNILTPSVGLKGSLRGQQKASAATISNYGVASDLGVSPIVSNRVAEDLISNTVQRSRSELRSTPKQTVKQYADVFGVVPSRVKSNYFLPDYKFESPAIGVGAQIIGRKRKGLRLNPVSRPEDVLGMFL